MKHDAAYYEQAAWACIKDANDAVGKDLPNREATLVARAQVWATLALAAATEVPDNVIRLPHPAGMDL